MIITVIGNDSRQHEFAKISNQKYDTIYLSGSEDISIVKSILKISEIVVLPLPLTKDNKTINTTDFSINEIAKAIPKNATVFAGMVNKSDFSCKVIDYNEIEDFIQKNALYTAEAAVAISIINTPLSLSEAKVLILGNGRISKYISIILSQLCKNITVSARKQKDFDYLKQNGLSYINSNNITDLYEYDIIFNTVPANIITKPTLKTLRKTALIIELTSKNSGLFTDEKKYNEAKALPAKNCKNSTTKALFDSVRKYF